ncbi:MAG: hypothetical protein U5K54_21900 [Cytophagales bacterium]|nr:hypothetical protein [Cytophagales bacterium]
MEKPGNNSFPLTWQRWCEAKLKFNRPDLSTLENNMIVMEILEASKNNLLKEGRVIRFEIKRNKEAVSKVNYPQKCHTGLDPVTH